MTNISVPTNYVFGSAGDVAVLKLASLKNGAAVDRINTQQRPAFGTSGFLVGYGLTSDNVNDNGVKRFGQSSSELRPGLAQRPARMLELRPAARRAGHRFQHLSRGFGRAVVHGFRFRPGGGGRHRAGAKTNARAMTPPSIWMFVNRAFIQSIAGADLNNTRVARNSAGQTGTTVLPFSGQLNAGTRQATHSISVPAGVSLLRINLNGDQSGNDFDLYVKINGAVSTSSFDCRPFLTGNFEQCSFASPPAGTWNILADLAGGPGGIYQITATLFGVSAPPPPPSTNHFLNISTNGFVDTTGMIAGFIVTGSQAKSFVFTAEDQGSGLDPTLRLTKFPGGELVAENDDWRDQPNAAQIEAALGRQPNNDLASALLVSLPPGAYLATLRGVNGGTGRGLVGGIEAR
ncbi:MAG: PPC domain-containing protein [Gammaproteobacteria bacterium]